MFKKLPYLFVSLALTVLMILAAGCNVPTPPPTIPASATPANPIPTSAQATAELATATPPAEPSATQPAPAENTATPEPTQAQPQGGSAPVISAANAGSLSETTLTLAEYPNELIWPAETIQIPGDASPRPTLLIQSGANLHPMLLDPIGLGYPIPLPLNGAEILAAAPNGTSLVIRDPSRTAVFALNGPIIRELPQPSQVYSASYSPDGRYLAVAGTDQIEAYLYDLSSAPDSAPIAHLTGFETAAPVYSVLVAPGGKTVAWHARATLQLQDVATGQMGQRLSFQDFIGPIAFSADGSKLALSVFSQVYIYTLPDGQEMAHITLSQDRNASSLAFSPDGSLLAAGYGANLAIWNGATLAPIAEFPGPNSSTSLVAFSPDGRYIVSAHDENIFGVWKAQ